MKYCSKCGNEMLDEAVICIKCGCMVGEKVSVANEKKVTEKETKNDINLVKPSAFGFLAILLGIISMVLSILVIAIALKMAWVYYSNLVVYYLLGFTIPAIVLAGLSLIFSIISFKDKEHPFAPITRIVLATCALILSILLVAL